MSAVLRVVLRSGAELEADVDAASLALTEDPRSERLATLTWDTPAGAARALRYVAPDEIAAVVLHTEPAGGP